MREAALEQSDVELKALMLEERRLRNQLLKYELEKMQLKKSELLHNHEQVEKDLADMMRQSALRRRQCNHRKGGRGMEGIRGQGSANEYSIFKHQFPNGEWFIICSRCTNEWRSPDPNDPNYPALYQAYQTALMYPTDNIPSGGSIFTFKDSTTGVPANFRWGQV